MTTDDVKRILHNPYKPVALAALSYVNLTDRELDTLILRYMRGMTLEKAAEWFDCSVNAVKNWQNTGLEKCKIAWQKIVYVQEILAAP